MNGFMAHNKRLKVSIKKGEEQYVPQHLLAPPGGLAHGQGPPMAGGMLPQMQGVSPLGLQSGMMTGAPQMAAPQTSSQAPYGAFPTYAPQAHRYAPY